MKFGALFRSIRRAQRWSLADVADRCGVHRATIWKIERGEHPPRGETFRRVCLLGLRLKEDSKEFRDLRARWTELRMGVAIDTADHVREIAGVNRRTSDDVAGLVAEIESLPEYLRTEVRRTLSTPAVLAMLKTLNDLTK